MSTEKNGNGMKRRAFLKGTGVAVAGTCAAAYQVLAQTAPEGDRPNVLWITSEDNSPFMGCYGDTVARTPNLDALAAEGVCYDYAFANMPQCAPARATIITGMYPTSIGFVQHFRHFAHAPEGVDGFPVYLRAAGYYCTNNDKTDYNMGHLEDNGPMWDESSRTAHYNNRPEGTPFFSVFNLNDSHEGFIFDRRWDGGARTPVTNPADVVLPPYHPDDPVVREDWGRYYDCMEDMDSDVGRLLAELDAAGLAEDTIVFYYGDHGGVLPRSKRFVYDSGTRVPLIIRFPAKYQHLAPASPGGRCDELVSFLDLAPTMLSLTGVTIPSYMQGRAFLGDQKGPEPLHVFMFRSGSGERHDLIRSARSKRYRYIRNYQPHIPPFAHVNYMWEIRSYPRIEEMYLAGQLDDVQRRLWCEKPFEELYDVEADPHEVTNLAADPAHASTLEQMRTACDDWLVGSRDTGFVPESARWSGWRYSDAQDDATYPLARIVDTANKAASRNPDNAGELVTRLDDSSLAVAYWAATGCFLLGDDAAAAVPKLETLLTHNQPSMRLIAAQALHAQGRTADALPVIEAVATDDGIADRIKLAALEALEYIGEPASEVIGRLPAYSGRSATEAEYLRSCVQNGFVPICGEPPVRAAQPWNTSHTTSPSSATAPVRVRMFDARGRLVQAFDTRLPHAAQAWNRRDGFGRRVPPGGYMWAAQDRAGQVVARGRVVVQ